MFNFVLMTDDSVGVASFCKRNRAAVFCNQSLILYVCRNWGSALRLLSDGVSRQNVIIISLTASQSE